MEKLNVAVADDNEKMVENGADDRRGQGSTIGRKAHNGEEICNIIREIMYVVVLEYYYAENGRFDSYGTLQS